MKRFAVSCGVLSALLAMPGTGIAVPLTVAGTYVGSINGSPFSASATGSIDTAGPGGQLSMDMFAIPNDSFTPLAVGSSVVTVVCWSSAQPLDAAALNLFLLSGGNYTVNRIFSYPSLPGSLLTAVGTVSTVGAGMSFAVDLSGSYAGPTDIVGVANYTVDWVQGPGNSVLESGSAMLLLAGGGALELRIDTVYDGLTNPLNGPQHGVYLPNPTYVATGPTTGLFATQWTATLRSVPEPPTLALMLLAGMALSRRRQTRGHAASPGRGR